MKILTSPEFRFNSSRGLESSSKMGVCSKTSGFIQTHSTYVEGKEEKNKDDDDDFFIDDVIVCRHQQQQQQRSSTKSTGFPTGAL